MKCPFCNHTAHMADTLPDWQRFFCQCENDECQARSPLFKSGDEVRQWIANLRRDADIDAWERKA